MENDVILEECFHNQITEDEKVLWQGKPLLKSYILTALFKILPIGIFWVVLDAAFITIMLMSNMFNQNPYLAFIIIPFFIIHISPIWTWISGIIKEKGRYKTITYVITNKRILIKNEFYDLDIRKIDFSEIREYYVIKDIVDSITKTGDIIIKGETLDVAIINVKKVEEVLQILKENISKKEDDDNE